MGVDHLQVVAWPELPGDRPELWAEDHRYRPVPARCGHRLTYDPKDPTAPTIDSYEKLIKYLLAGNKQCLIKDTCCADFVAGITGAGAGLANSLLSGACDAATSLGSTFLEGYLDSLDAASGNLATGQGLILSTDSCPILDPNGDNIVDDLGSPDTTSTKNQCQWDMTLGIGSGPPTQISARFFAIREP